MPMLRVLTWDFTRLPVRISLVQMLHSKNLSS
jgi:hypothetical protein